jgi:hypothetical protein
MRKSSQVVIIAWLIILFFPVYKSIASDNLLINGDFKQGFKGWSRSIYGGSKNAKVLVQKDDDGQNYLSLNGFEKGVSSQAIASVPIQAGKQYNLDFKYKSTMPSFYAILYWKNLNGKILSKHLVGASGVKSAWTKWSTLPKRFVVFQPAKGKGINLKNKIIIAPEAATKLIIVFKSKGIGSFDLKDIMLTMEKIKQAATKDEGKGK